MIEHPFEKTLVQYIRLYRLQKTGRFYVVWLGTTLEALPLQGFFDLVRSLQSGNTEPFGHPVNLEPYLGHLRLGHGRDIDILGILGLIAAATGEQ